jgi:hypothetical protein
MSAFNHLNNSQKSKENSAGESTEANEAGKSEEDRVSSDIKSQTQRDQDDDHEPLPKEKISVLRNQPMSGEPLKESSDKEPLLDLVTTHPN